MMIKIVFCPLCKKKTDPKYRPFCSQRCQEVDLGRWLTGSYAIPTEEELNTELTPLEDLTTE